VYFSTIVETVLSACNVDKSSYPSVYEAYDDFIEKVNDRVEKYNLSFELSLFYKTFKEKNGVVITSCHKIKGEEYHTVIAFGILQGKIPNWDVIINNPSLSDDEARKMIYVIASRAKKELYLIAEQGRTTRSGSASLIFISFAKDRDNHFIRDISPKFILYAGNRHGNP